VSEHLCQCCIAGGKFICDCCKRPVDHVRGSMWHGDARICRECFSQWYDPDNESVDSTNPISIGNHIRKKHGLPALEPTP
jgi:hypothetical protein